MSVYKRPINRNVDNVNNNHGVSYSLNDNENEPEIATREK